MEAASAKGSSEKGCGGKGKAEGACYSCGEMRRKANECPSGGGDGYKGCGFRDGGFGWCKECKGARLDAAEKKRQGERIAFAF